MFKKKIKQALIQFFSLIEREPFRYDEAFVTLYHEVGKDASGYSVKDTTFDQQIEFLLNSNVNWVLATELSEKLNNLDLNNDVCVTFDDGAIRSYQATLKLIDKGARCSHFIIPGRVDEKNRKTMSWEQIIELDSLGVEIGSHTLSHAHLTRISKKSLVKELKESKNIIEDRLGKQVTSIAYPYGEFDQSVIEATRSNGYLCGYTTQHFYASKGIDRFHIPRFEPTGSFAELTNLFEGQSHYFYALLGHYLIYRNRRSS